MDGYFKAIGGTIQTVRYVQSLKELPTAKAILFNVGPKQLLAMAAECFSAFYLWLLNRYRYGVGVFKFDWVLDGAIPFRSIESQKAGTIHLGGTLS